MRVLVATDGSWHARYAMQWLLHFPLPLDTTISIVSAIPSPDVYGEMVRSARDEMRRQADEVVAHARRQLAEHRASVMGRVLEGDPRSVLVDAAVAEDADLLLIGARGLGAVATALLGSVSLAVARMAPCPVLVAKGAPRPLRSVTMALDGSDHAAAGLRFFAGLPLSRSLAVHLVSVVEPLRYPSAAPGIIAPQLMAAIADHEAERRCELEKVLTTAAGELRSRVGRVTTTAAVGRPAPSILAEAEKHASEPIVVGARGLGAVRRLLLGSVSESLLRHATCPVLIVRPRGGDGD